jgi:hypothetical protein
MKLNKNKNFKTRSMKKLETKRKEIKYIKKIEGQLLKFRGPYIKSKEREKRIKKIVGVKLKKIQDMRKHFNSIINHWKKIGIKWQTFLPLYIVYQWNYL